MKVRNKISRRAQVISAIAVAIVFGGGWLVVWKWPHLNLRFAIARASPELRAAMAKTASTLTMPNGVPAGWIPIDLALVEISVPPPVERIEAKDHTGIFIKLKNLEIYTGDLLAGRELVDDARARTSLRLFSNGNWRSADFVEYARAAHLASSTDFRWGFSLDEVYAMQQFLLFKGLNRVGDTRLFRGPHATGMVTLNHITSQPTGEEFGIVRILATTHDERDYVNLSCKFPSQAGAREIPTMLASFRFPNERYRGTSEDLARHIATLVTNPTATSQPAQP